MPEQLSPSKPRTDPARTARRAAAGIAALTFLLGVFLVLRYPVVYWDDSYTRLAYRDQLLVGRWLPAMQAIVLLTGKFPAGLAVLRILLTGIGAGCVLAIYRYTERVFDPLAGLLAAALLATNTLFIGLLTVPYREILIVTLCFLVLLLIEHTERARARAAAFALLILLTLTRYDAWLLVPIFVLLETGRGFEAGGAAGAVRTGLPAMALIGAVPVLWTLYGPIAILEHEGGILERVFSGEVGRLFASLGAHPWWRTRPDVLLLGAAGLILALRNPKSRRTSLTVLALIAVQFGFLMVAGIWRAENLRMTFFPVVMLIPFAAGGLAAAVRAAIGGLRRALPPAAPDGLPEWAFVLAGAVAFAILAAAGARFAAGAAHIPAYLSGHAAAAAFGDRLAAGVLVLTDVPAGPYVFSTYTGIPPARIFELGPTTLDHAAADPSPESLAAAGISHVVAVFAAAGGLSTEEAQLLAALESGVFAALLEETDGVRIWELAPTGDGP